MRYAIKKPDIQTTQIPDIYTITEVAEMLKVSKRTIERLMYESRKLPYLKIGRTARIRKRDIQRFLDQAVI